MTRPTYGEALLQPLTTDALVQHRVSALVGRACRRQLWFLFLDEHQVQLPIIIPIGDIPLAPDVTVTQLSQLIAHTMESANASSVIVVLERYADEAVTESDRLWARAISSEFGSAGITVRCLLISHRRGVRWFAADDYLV
jgi:hypothetical protein